jgi:hypothetical protein
MDFGGKKTCVKDTKQKVRMLMDIFLSIEKLIINYLGRNMCTTCCLENSIVLLKAVWYISPFTNFMIFL